MVLSLSIRQVRRCFQMKPPESTLFLSALVCDAEQYLVTSARLAEISGYSPETVKRGIRSLINRGLLSKEPQRNNGRFQRTIYNIIDNLNGEG